MNDKYLFKVMCARENIFCLKKEKFDIKNEVDELSYQPIVIEIRKVDNIDNEEEEELVAIITGLYFNIENMRDCGFSLFDVFDSIDQNIYDLYEALFTDEEYKEEFEVFNQNLFYLDNIVVEDAYKNKGLGKIIIKQIDEIVKYVVNLNVGVIATNLYKNEDAKLNNKLDEMLVDKGFVKASSDNSYYVLEIL